jgi:uncharacterized membrane protein
LTFQPRSLIPGLLNASIIMAAMLVLRYVHVLALSVWLGGMAVLGGLVAPATFAVLDARMPGGDGRALAGVLFAQVLRRFHPVAYVCGAALLLTLLGMRILGPKPPQVGVRAGIVAVMLALSLYSGLVLSPQIERMQSEVGVSVRSLPDTDPRRARFGRLHGLSTTLMLVNMVGGLVLLYWHARD